MTRLEEVNGAATSFSTPDIALHLTGSDWHFWTSQVYDMSSGWQSSHFPFACNANLLDGFILTPQFSKQLKKKKVKHPLLIFVHGF